MKPSSPDFNELSLDPNPYLRIGALAVAGLILGFGLWAGFARLDGAVLAPGKVSVEGQRKTVQATGGGVVNKLLVKDGETVSEGQVLIRIDRTVRSSARSGARARLDGLLAKRSRLESEWEKRTEIDFDNALVMRARESSTAEIMTAESAFFLARREARSAEADALAARIPKLEAIRRGHQARAKAARAEQAAAAESLTGARQLFEQGYLSKARLRAIERDHVRAEGQAALSESEAESAHREIAEIRSERERNVKQQRERLAEELEQVRRQILTAQESLVSADQELRYTAVRAPARGRVFGLAIHTEGGVVREGDPLLQIVPERAPLIVEARIPVHEVDRISQGQEARVQLSAFDTNAVPPVAGVVESISADRFEEPSSSVAFYLARIRISESALDDLPEIELRAGMPAETWISTGRKSALHYLMEPFTDSWSRAFVDG